MFRNIFLTHTPSGLMTEKTWWVHVLEYRRGFIRNNNNWWCSCAIQYCTRCADCFRCRFCVSASVGTEDMSHSPSTYPSAVTIRYKYVIFGTGAKTGEPSVIGIISNRKAYRKFLSYTTHIKMYKYFYANGRRVENFKMSKLHTHPHTFFNIHKLLQQWLGVI